MIFINNYTNNNNVRLLNENQQSVTIFTVNSYFETVIIYITQHESLYIV